MKYIELNEAQKMAVKEELLYMPQIAELAITDPSMIDDETAILLTADKDYKEEDFSSLEDEKPVEKQEEIVSVALDPKPHGSSEYVPMIVSYENGVIHIGWVEA